MIDLKLMDYVGGKRAHSIVGDECFAKSSKDGCVLGSLEGVGLPRPDMWKPRDCYKYDLSDRAYELLDLLPAEEQMNFRNNCISPLMDILGSFNHQLKTADFEEIEDTRKASKVTDNLQHELDAARKTVVASQLTGGVPSDTHDYADAVHNKEYVRRNLALFLTSPQISEHIVKLAILHELLPHELKAQSANNVTLHILADEQRAFQVDPLKGFVRLAAKVPGWRVVCTTGENNPYAMRGEIERQKAEKGLAVPGEELFAVLSDSQFSSKHLAGEAGKDFFRSIVDNGGSYCIGMPSDPVELLHLVLRPGRALGSTELNKEGWSVGEGVELVVQRKQDAEEDFIPQEGVTKEWYDEKGHHTIDDFGVHRVDGEEWWGDEVEDSGYGAAGAGNIQDVDYGNWDEVDEYLGEENEEQPQSEASTAATGEMSQTETADETKMEPQAEEMPKKKVASAGAC